MSDFEQRQARLSLDLRGFRQSLAPRKTLGQVARGAQVDKSLLSRVERGKQGISCSFAGSLARYYSRVTGECVTAGEVFEMAERGAARRRAGREGSQRIRSSVAMTAPDVAERSVLDERKTNPVPQSLTKSSPARTPAQKGDLTMASRTTYVKTLRDWEELLAAAAEHAQAMPEAEDLRAALERHVVEARAIKARQDSARASRQGLTQELTTELVAGREVARRLRGIATARIGAKSEKIVQFGMAPLRKRSRRAKVPDTAPPIQPPGPPALPANQAVPAISALQKGGEESKP